MVFLLIFYCIRSLAQQDGGGHYGWGRGHNHWPYQYSLSPYAKVPDADKLPLGNRETGAALVSFFLRKKSIKLLRKLPKECV